MIRDYVIIPSISRKTKREKKVARYINFCSNANKGPLSIWCNNTQSYFINSNYIKITNNFVFFWDGWLSNFYPCRIIFDSKVFKSSEQLFMYLKALYFGDLEIAEKILSAITPKEAKKLGRQVKNFDSKSWDEVKISKMYIALEEKFSQNKDLMDKLKDPMLDNKFFVEASPFDRIWGIGYDENHALQNISDWGENLLGKTITFYRGSL